MKKKYKSDAAPELDVKTACFSMDDSGIDKSVPAFNNNAEEFFGKWNSRSKRQIKKKITLMYLLKVICASRESCLEWLKFRNFIPKIMFCPNCSKKMKLEANKEAVDGYIWTCPECTDNPPRFSTRHGSWLESKDAPLVDILLFTYLWSHGFSDEQICQETNMSRSFVEEYNLVYSTICDSLYQRSMLVDDDVSEGSTLDIKKESSAAIWRNKNKNKDPFVEFLKDADSL